MNGLSSTLLRRGSHKCALSFSFSPASPQHKEASAEERTLAPTSLLWPRGDMLTCTYVQWNIPEKAKQGSTPSPPPPPTGVGESGLKGSTPIGSTLFVTQLKRKTYLTIYHSEEGAGSRLLWLVGIIGTTNNFLATKGPYLYSAQWFNKQYYLETIT